MGMFDYLIIDTDRLPLSDSDKKKIGKNPGWQTKDLDCTLSTAEITSDGRIAIRRFEHEIVPEADRPYPNDPGILGMIGMLREVNTRTEYVSEPIVTFYTDIQGEWFEFNAYFDDGILTKIERLDNV